jgi:acyl-coenzyme A thioesterase PaaI-like protein
MVGAMAHQPNAVYARWLSLKDKPGGKRLFSFLLGRMVPYSGSISPYVEELGPGHCVVKMHDRGKLRNHLNSIHAVALMNLGELSSGLAVISAIPPDARGILAGLSIEYLKKGRGTLQSVCNCPVLESSERKEYEVAAEITDRENEVVARVTARWLVGPKDR